MSDPEPQEEDGGTGRELPQPARRPAIGRARLRRLRSSHSYGYVLLLVVASFTFTAAAPGSGWSQGLVALVESCTFTAAVWTSGLSERKLFLVTPVAVGLVVALAVSIVGGETGAGIAGLVSAILTVSACVAIALGVLDQQQVNRQSIVGAVSIYLEMGMLFTFVYGAVAQLGSGTFFAQGTSGTPSLRLYFSFVTLATLGYGDYTPAATLGRTLAVVEAVIGQLYLVTVLAILVGNLGSSERRPH